MQPPNGGAERAAEARPKRPYTQSELSFLCRLSGEDPMVLGDLTSDVLPPFWKDFEQARAKLPTAREFIESYLDNNWPPNEPAAQRFVSTAIVQSMVSLDFHGGDINMMPSKRGAGLSVYSIYPLEDDADTGDLRTQSMAFEETMGTHTPEHRETMSKLTSATTVTPAHRDKLWRWVRYYATVMRLIFGAHMIVLPHLRRLAELLGQVVPFRYYQPNQFRALFWKYHCCMRQSFRPGQRHGDPTEAFNDLLARLRQGVPVYPTEVPSEVIVPQSANKPVTTVTQTDPREKNATNKTLSGPTKPVIERIARITLPAMTSALEAAKKANARITSREIFPNGIGEALGSIQNLVKPTSAGNKAACPRLFVYGRCTVRCRASHQLTKEPPNDAIKHYTDWVERRAATLKANPKA